ncbi:MAG: DUF3575 domain-containing protein [Leeuwenhoekiella sp.]
MKTTLLNAALLLSVFISYAQTDSIQSLEQEVPKNEIKVNGAYLIAGILEISYERLLSDESSVGFSIGASIDSDIDYTFFLTPFYRFFFGKKRAAGFFVEANSNLYAEELNDDPSDQALGLGVGLAIGGKFVTKGGWVAEILAGAGRNFVNTNQIEEGYPRLGLSIGKRF